MTMSPSVPDDQIAIGHLLALYCHRLDRGTAEEIVALFVPSAVLCPAFEGPDELHGHDAIRGWFTRYIMELRPTMRRLRHLLAPAQVDVDGDHATSVAYFSANFVRAIDNRFTQAFGTYTDELVRTNVGWRFAYRRIEADLMVQGPEIG